MTKPTDHPRSKDEAWESVLEWMGVPDHSNVYVLGSFATHVTFYSQQVRALNLVDALCSTGRVHESSRVAVVGGGLAGLTFAAGALQRGLRVDLFEKEGATASTWMPLQIACKKRFIDPLVYDWPREATDTTPTDTDSRRAGLPILDWKANAAESVRDEVLKGFKGVRTDHEGRFRSHALEVTEKDIVHDADATLSVKGEGPFDVLVLAVGFGVEAEPHTVDRYWTDDRLDGKQADKKVYLVSGTGDGGLTDLMRLCIPDFRHGKVLKMFGEGNVARELGVRLVKAERKNRKREVQRDLSTHFLVAAKMLSVVFKERSTTVYVASNVQRLFTSNASILNRLIVACLLRSGRFKLIDARVQTPVDGDVIYRTWKANRVSANPKVRHFEEGRVRELKGARAPRQFAGVIIRHGPGEVVELRKQLTRISPLESDFGQMFARCLRQRRKWKDTPHWDDWTRLPQWDPEAFGKDCPRLDPDLRGPKSCVVVEDHRHRVGDSTSLRALTRNVLDKKDGEPFSVDAADATRSAFEYGQAVRALCRARIAVFDLTGMSPEMMLFLGVRAAARRGVTILTSWFKNRDSEPAPSDAPFELGDLPFNLRDVTRYGRGPNEEAFSDRLKKGIMEGLNRYETLGSRYSDLPVYEAVRELGNELKDVRPIASSKEVLLLSWFDLEHRKRLTWVKRKLRSFVTGELSWIVQTPSPELVTSKLYSRIRRTEMCVVDWTELRPNVFFEMGIRLAVNESPPICVAHHSEDEAKADGLRKLFCPVKYGVVDAESLETSFEKDIEKRSKFIQGAEDDEGEKSQWPIDEGELSPGFTYRQVRGAVDIRSEGVGIQTHEVLKQSAAALAHWDVLMYPESIVLFGDRPDIDQCARRSAADTLFAAWLLLREKHRLTAARLSAGDFDDKKGPAEAMHEIGMRLRTALRGEEDSVYKRVLGQVSLWLAKAGTLK